MAQPKLIGLLCVSVSACTTYHSGAREAQRPIAEAHTTEFVFSIGYDLAVLPFPDWGWCVGKGVLENFAAGVEIINMHVDGKEMHPRIRGEVFDLGDSALVRAQAPFVYLAHASNLLSIRGAGPRDYALPREGQVLAAEAIEVRYRIFCADERASPEMITRGRREDVVRRKE